MRSGQQHRQGRAGKRFLLLATHTRSPVCRHSKHIEVQIILEETAFFFPLQAFRLRDIAGERCRSTGLLLTPHRLSFRLACRRPNVGSVLSFFGPHWQRDETCGRGQRSYRFGTCCYRKYASMQRRVSPESHNPHQLFPRSEVVARCAEACGHPVFAFTSYIHRWSLAFAVYPYRLRVKRRGASESSVTSKLCCLCLLATNLSVGKRMWWG